MCLGHGVQVNEVHTTTSKEILQFLDHAFRRALSLVQHGLKRIDAIENGLTRFSIQGGAQFQRLAGHVDRRLGAGDVLRFLLGLVPTLLGVVAGGIVKEGGPATTGFHRDFHALLVEEGLEVCTFDLDHVDHQSAAGVFSDDAGHQAEGGLESSVHVSGCTVEGFGSQFRQSCVASSLLFVAASNVKSLHAPGHGHARHKVRPARQHSFTHRRGFHARRRPGLMRRLLAVALVALFVLAVPAAAAPAVVLSDGGSIEAPGALLGMDVRPGGEAVLLVGEDGWAHHIDGLQPERRELDVELGTGRNVNINAVDWHPGGATALMVGDAGVLLRYVGDTHAITNGNGSNLLMGRDLIDVAWRPGADVAYIASQDGGLWRFAEGTGPVVLEEGLETQDIVDIECHRSANVCIVATSQDGLAVIGRSHQVTWLTGTSTTTWSGITCADPTLNECTAFGLGLSTMTIMLDTETAARSTTGPLRNLKSIGSEMGGASVAAGGTTLVHISPLGLIRHDPVADEAYEHLGPDQAVAFDAQIAGRSILGVWESDVGTGWFLTTDGDLVGMVPDTSDQQSSVLETVAGIAVAVALIGSIIGLIFMNSPKLQAAYIRRRNARRSRQG